MLRIALVIEAVNKTVQPLREAGAAVDRLRNRVQAARQGMIGQMMEAAGWAAALAAPLQAAIKFESAMAGVAKVVDFPAPTGLAALSKELVGLTATIPLTAVELAEIAAAGGQLGVAAGDIAGFVVQTAKMATAFDMNAAAAGKAAALIANVYGLPVTALTGIGDVVNKLADKTAADASDVIEVLGRIGGQARLFGLSAEQTAALGGAFSALGKPPEVAATAIEGMLKTLQGGREGTKDFKAGLAEIGLTADQMVKQIESGGQAALLSLLDKISKLDNTKQVEVLKKLFGDDNGSHVATLTTNLHRYREAIALVEAKTGTAGSMEREFQIRSKTTENQLKLTQNAVQEIAITLGTMWLPTINQVLRGLVDLVRTVSGWAKANPELAQSLTTAAVALGGLAIGSLVAKLAVVGLAGGVLSVVGAVRTVISVLRTLTLFAVANPLGALVAVLALAAVAILTDWEGVKKFFTDIWNDPKAALVAFLDWIGAATKSALEGVAAVWAWLADQIQPVIAALAEAKAFVSDNQITRLVGLSGPAPVPATGPMPAATPAPGAGVAGAEAGAVKVETGGVLKIEIAGPPGTRVTQAQPADPAQAWQIDRGLSLAF